MSGQFNLLEFLRKIPVALLRDYCSQWEEFADFDWGDGKRVDVERFAEVLNAASLEVSDEIISTFKTIFDFADAGFTRGILNEARFHDDDEAYEAIESQPNHWARAFWAITKRPNYIEQSKVIQFVDKIPPGSWIKRRGIPLRPGPVDESMVERLQDGLIEFFISTQHRGRNCKIDCLQHGDEEIFFAAAEDYPQTHLVWEEGEQTPQTIKPGFPLIFRHDDKLRTLDIYIEGDNAPVPGLQVVFANAVLGEELSEELPDDEIVYDIDRILVPGFEFRHSSDLGIKSVDVVKMRFVVLGEPWRRFIVEAKSTDVLNDLFNQLTIDLPQEQLLLDQIWLNVKFHRRERDRRARSHTFSITPPNTVRLKKDELGNNIAQMLIQSGIEVQTMTAEDEAFAE